MWVIISYLSYNLRLNFLRISDVSLEVELTYGADFNVDDAFTVDEAKVAFLGVDDQSVEKSLVSTTVDGPNMDFLVSIFVGISSVDEACAVFPGVYLNVADFTVDGTYVVSVDVV